MPPALPTAITIYSRPGCHLCDEMKSVVERVLAAVDGNRNADAFVLDEVDISTDPALEARYGLEIPVLMIDGRKAAKYRVGEQELRRLLDARH
jgi:glutaredoxin